MFVIPIEKDNPVRHEVWVVYSLIAVNTLIMVLVAMSGELDRACTSLGFTPAAPSWLTVFTSMFLHAGLWHIQPASRVEHALLAREGECEHRVQDFRGRTRLVGPSASSRTNAPMAGRSGTCQIT